MDKYEQKTSFCKWITTVSFENLPLRLQRTNWTDKCLCQEALFRSFPQADAPRSLKPKGQSSGYRSFPFNPRPSS